MSCRSDISVWHKIRVAPTILFYDEGAVVSSQLLSPLYRHFVQLGAKWLHILSSATLGCPLLVGVAQYHPTRPEHLPTCSSGAFMQGLCMILGRGGAGVLRDGNDSWGFMPLMPLVALIVI